MPEPRKSNAAWWIAGGCLFALVVASGIAVGVFYWGTKKVTRMAEEAADPAVREREAKELLGATALPPGYHAGLAASVGIGEMVHLTDTPQTSSETKFTDRGFVYFEHTFSPKQSRIGEYLAGAKGNTLEYVGTRLRTDEVLGNGLLNMDGQFVQYSARRGEFAVNDQAFPGFFTVFTVVCNNDDRERWAVWFEKAAAGAKSGTVTDEGAMKAFFGHFSLCR